MEKRKAKVPGELRVLELDIIPPSLSDVSATTTTPQEPLLASPSRSLGIGSFTSSGKVENFAPSPTRQHKTTTSLRSRKPHAAEQHHAHVAKHLSEGTKSPSIMGLLERIEKASPVVFKRALSSFLRVADLDMDATVHSVSDLESEESFPNYHFSSADPPPGVDADPNELWVCLDNGDGEHAPIAPLAVSALAKTGLNTTFDQHMWNPESKTAKLVKLKEHAWHTCSWEKDGPVVLPAETTAASEKEVLVWSGNFTHGRYGSELPAVRSAGLINMPAEALMDLLVDSNRVKEYNKMSLGRTDLLVLQNDLDGGTFGGITKVMRSETRPPMIRKTLSFTSILHVRKLDDGSGFKLVSRAVTSPVDSSIAGTLQSEILLSVNIIKKVEGNPNQCMMIAVNHIRSPMVPMMIAKRLGLTAAVNFINDLRACC